MHYTRTGGNKPPVILLHGLTANGACWTEVVHHLEGDFDLVMPDARGHGSSSKPAAGYRYEDHANDVVGLLKALQLPPSILIGHSMGGMTAALVASRHPELLDLLILADPTFLSLDVQRQVHESNVTDQHRRYLDWTVEEIMAESLVKHPNRSEETIELIAKARLQTSIHAFEVLTPPNPDYLQVVNAIKIPTLLVIGGPTGLVSPEVAVELQRINRRLQVAQIPEASHGLHYDQPAEFVSLMNEFLHSTVGRSAQN